MAPFSTRLTWIQPVPPARELPAHYDRHHPEIEDQRSAMILLTADTDWAGLSWSELIEELIALGRTDVPLSRLGEGHVDALRILAQAGAAPAAGALYGVWASRSQRTGVRATPIAGGGLCLQGTLRFASGAGLLDRALVPVWLSEDHHVLVDLGVAELPVDASVWRTGAMAASRTYEVTVDGVAVPTSALVGEQDFYLARPGFFPGGVGVAACWVGGAARVLDLLRMITPHPRPAQQLRFGRIRTDLVAALGAVRAAAAWLDETALDETALNELASGTPESAVPDLQAVAVEARAVAADAVRRILTEARSITGPTGLALDDGVGHAVPDLELYVLQQNGDSDAEFLGDAERQP